MIYIPICFYFNYIWFDTTLVGLQFTFQYVSILIVAHRKAFDTWDKFTFQYVSILIEFETPEQDYYDIYIPICFYFN